MDSAHVPLDLNLAMRFLGSNYRQGAHIIKDGRRGLRARPLDHNAGATHPVDYGKAPDPRHSEFCTPAFPCPAQGACGRLDGRRHTRKAACASPKFSPALKSTACTLSSVAASAMTVSYVPPRRIMVGLFTRCFQSHRSLLLENLVLRQQLAVLKCKHPRPRIGAVDKIFWVFAVVFLVLGSSLWGWSSLRPSLAGIALVFDCTGV